MVKAPIKNVDQIIREVDNYISKHGGGYPSWYVGIASDPRDRLFNYHGVKENGDPWIFRDCDSSTAARNVEQYFLELGCKGGAGGGEDTTRYVYAYKIKSHTRE